jgi:cytidine deaminase
MDRRTALMTLISAGAGAALSASTRGAGEGHGLNKSDSNKPDLDKPGSNRLGATSGRDTDELAQILPNFAAESRAKLRTLAVSSTFTGQIPAAMVRELCASEGKTVAAIMLALLPFARTFSRPPISNYRVGAVAEGVSGSLYLGFNIEFPGQPLGFAVHGEQSALSSAYMHGEEGVSSIAVTAAPCGHCRQFMNELSPDGQIEILVDKVSSETHRLGFCEYGSGGFCEPCRRV